MISLNVRKLVALDMLFILKRWVVLEFAAGVLLAGFLGLLSFRMGHLLVGLILMFIGLNYVPLFVHAVDLARNGTAHAEAGGDLAEAAVARTYAWRQLWILVPLAVVAFDLAQRAELRKR